jgi:hypothetical protein
MGSTAALTDTSITGASWIGRECDVVISTIDLRITDLATAPTALKLCILDVVRKTSLAKAPFVQAKTSEH